MNFQHREKLFYAKPFFPDWPYKSGNAVGFNLNEPISGAFPYRLQPIWRIEYRGDIYEIEREKAIELGEKYQLGPQFKMPHMIPIDEWKIAKSQKSLL